MSDVTFIFEDDRAYAMRDGQVVASASTIEQLEAKLDESAKEAKAAAEKTATHITTPSGLTGQILGRTKDLWGETVTVRFANNNIAEIRVNADLTFHREASEDESTVDGLRARLAASEKGTMAERREVLQGIVAGAHGLVAQAAHDEARQLDEIIAAAKSELQVIADVQAELDAQEGESFIPEAPFQPTAVEQASLGGHTSSWLDDIHGDMVREANETDFDALLNEGPEAFTAELETATLADQGVVAHLASAFVADKTALAEPELRQKFASAFLDRVERCRRQELQTRKATVQKEAKKAAEDVTNVPDDALFS